MHGHAVSLRWKQLLCALRGFNGVCLTPTLPGEAGGLRGVRASGLRTNHRKVRR